MNCWWTSIQSDSIVHATSAASFRVDVTSRGPDSGAFSTWTEVRNGPTDAATRSRGRRTRERAREERGVRDMEGGGRGSDGEREGGGREMWEGGFSRGKWGNEILYLSPPFSLFLSLSFSYSILLSPSLLDEEGAQSGL